VVFCSKVIAMKKSSQRKTVLCVVVCVLATGGAIWIWLADDRARKTTGGENPRAGTEGPALADAVRKAPFKKPEYSQDINAGLWEPVAVDPANPRIRFSLFHGGDRKLTSQAIEYAAVPRDRVPVVQKAIDDLWVDMSKLVAAKAEVDPLRNDPEKGISAFRIPPFAQEGSEARKAFGEKLRSIVGAESGAKLMETFSWVNYFGAFGQQEILVQFAERQVRDEMVMGATWEARHPETGKRASRASGNFEMWAKHFGTSLQIKE
jgi:hypothetical protein